MNSHTSRHLLWDEGPVYVKVSASLQEFFISSSPWKQAIVSFCFLHLLQIRSFSNHVTGLAQVKKDQTLGKN